MGDLPPGAALGSHNLGRLECAACKNRPLSRKPAVPVMDIEHINQIGNSLADLAARTDALRGYL
jgi:hypothetical protein